MRQIILIIHTSLDGYVAGPNGEFDGFEASEENLEFVCKITEDADAALMGRRSYELLEGDWPTKKDRPDASPAEIAFSHWYIRARRIVISKTLSGKKVSHATVIGDNLMGEITRIKQAEGRNILIFGSPSVAQVLTELGLIDSYWIFINPALFGEGISLFSKLPQKIKLRLASTRLFANGELAINYLVDHSGTLPRKSTY